MRHDVDLARVGEVADLPPDSSPIQIATEGVWRNKPFVVVGRILYEYAQGGWNEWHVIFNDSSSGWVSDAQLEYAISFLTPVSGALPAPGEIQRGQAFQWNNTSYQVTSITRAKYRGVEGELPFEYWDKDEVPFADLRTFDGNFATLDYSDEAHPLLFAGHAVEFEELALKNLREFEGWR
ncbi:MAG: DUF4178 domain-containing protein [Bryobacteraceae bacterium]